MSDRIIRLGIAGLGRAFMLMLPTFSGDARVRIAACADPREEARAQFVGDFGGRATADMDVLCADPEIDAIYIASPHQFHVAHVQAAARAGKHVLVEKPMALTLADCAAMVAATEAAGVHLLVGHSHSFNTPYLEARKLIASGALGPLRMLTLVNFTDFLYRPRRPEELDTAQGGGVVFSQGAHHVDVARLLGGGRVKSVRAVTGQWDQKRPTEGAYSAFLTFEDGTVATLTYNGYGYFDTDEFMGWTGELGNPRDPAVYGAARAALKGVASADEEAALKNRRTYGAGGHASAPQGPRLHNHFGLVIASCERGDIRPLPDALMVYGEARERIALAHPNVPRSEVIDEMHAAIFGGIAPLHSGAWGMATMEVCLAILESARTGSEIALSHQCELPEGR